MQAKLFLFVSAVACAGASAACVTPQNCNEWVKLGQGRSLIYRSHPLETKDAKITRALVVIHGAGRNADDYFRSGVAAAFLAGALDDTIVISPRFASSDGRSCKDKLGEGEINWRCSGDSWRSGGKAVSDEKVTSYDLTDEILRKLARKDVFPNLKTIVLTGHSAGGQYVSRYVAANTVHDKLGVPVTYVISNPSSYAYLDASRPGDTAKCADSYNAWPYGLTARTGYSAKVSDDQMKANIVARPVIFLLSELDTLPIAGFDSSCPAMAQGPSRFARGQAYAEYLSKNFGAKHTVTVVPLCGHNARCVYTADPALPILFPGAGN